MSAQPNFFGGMEMPIGKQSRREEASKKVKVRKAFVTGLLSTMLISNSMVYASGKENDLFFSKEKEVIVGYKTVQGRELVRSMSSTNTSEISSIFTIKATLSENEIVQLKSIPDIEYVEENVPLQVQSEIAPNSVSPASVSIEEEYWPYQMMVPGAIAQSDGITGAGVKVAVVDSGIAPHSDLRIAGGVSTVGALTGNEPEASLPSAYMDTHGHGTHVAGIIGALNNGMATVGVAPGAEIYAIKVLGSSDGKGDLQDILEGINWAIANDIDVINLSLGTNTHTQSFQAAVDLAKSRGILVVAAAGNDGVENVAYPARYDSVIAVSALTQQKTLADFSNYGAQIDFTAPGKSIISTYINNSHALMDGTSQAAPYIAGLYALMKEKYPNYTSDQLTRLLQANSEDLGVVGFDKQYGFGLPTYSYDKTAPDAVSTSTPAPDSVIVDSSEIGTVKEESGVITIKVIPEKVVRAIEEKGKDFVFDFSHLPDNAQTVTFEVTQDVVRNALERVGNLKFATKKAKYSLDAKAVDSQKDLITTLDIRNLKASEKVTGVKYVSSSYSIKATQASKPLMAPVFKNIDLTINHQGKNNNHLVVVMKDDVGHLKPVPFVHDGQNGFKVKAKWNKEYVLIESAKTFKDVKGSWNQQMVEKLASRKIINGLTEQSFGPNKNVTFTEATALVIRSIGEGSVESPKNWSSVIIAKGKELDLLKGISATAGTQQVDRLTAVKLMVNAIEKVGMDSVKLDATKTIDHFKDIPTLTKEEKRVLQIALQSGIIDGYKDNTFRPYDKLTRAQLVKVLYKMMESVGYLN